MPNMPNDQELNTDALRVEIDRLNDSDTNEERRRKFALLVRANVRHWHQRKPAELPATRWELLEARLARIDVQYAPDPGSLFYAQALTDLANLLHPMLIASDPAWVIRCPRRLTLLRRLLPHDAYRIWGARP